MPAIPWRFEEHLRRYRDLRTGRFIGPSQMHDLREQFADAMTERTAALAGQLVGHEITLQQWVEEMRGLIRTAHSDLAMLGRGGLRALDAQDLQTLQEVIRGQYTYLQRFAGVIASGDLSEGQIAVRAGMYMSAARMTYEDMQRRTAVQAGAVLEANRRHALESCQGCVAESARGWVPVGTLSPPGTRSCKANCRCTLEYAYGEGM